MRLLLGGSPCTHWSIAQKNGRETEPSGLGWELFRNYLVAKEKFKPDFFIYENNKSAARPIKDQIKIELGAWDGTLLMQDSGARYIEINSALVSAQNRQRFYVHNLPNVEQPEDRGILLKDILESGVDLSQNEKGYCLTSSYAGAVAWNTLERGQRTMVAEPIPVNDIDGKARTIRATCYKDGIRNLIGNDVDKRTCVAEPIRIGTIESDSHTDHDSKQYRVYSPEGKSTTICGQGGGVGAKTGLYACPIKYLNDKNMEHLMRPFGSKGKILHQHSEKAPTIMAAMGTGGGNGIYIAEQAISHNKNIYHVKNGYITIKDKQYPIKLPDGFYIIRKLTVKECMRLQTVPEWYQMPCSNSQNYKMLGNGWTVEVIKHILKSLPKNEPLEVLSMYDGMSCGQIALKEMGCNVAKYVSYEIDKYAIQTTQTNFPNTIQRGDAFAIRNSGWEY